MSSMSYPDGALPCLPPWRYRWAGGQGQAHAVSQAGETADITLVNSDAVETVLGRRACPSSLAVIVLKRQHPQ